MRGHAPAQGTQTPLGQQPRPDSSPEAFWCPGPERHHIDPQPRKVPRCWSGHTPPAPCDECREQPCSPDCCDGSRRCCIKRPGPIPPLPGDLHPPSASATHLLLHYPGGKDLLNDIGIILGRLLGTAESRVLLSQLIAWLGLCHPPSTERLLCSPPAGQAGLAQSWNLAGCEGAGTVRSATLTLCSPGQQGHSTAEFSCAGPSS